MVNVIFRKINSAKAEIVCLVAVIIYLMTGIKTSAYDVIDDGPCVTMEMQTTAE